MFQYLKDFPERGIVIDYRDLDCVPELPVPDPSFSHQYPYAFEEIDPTIPKPFGQHCRRPSFFILTWLMTYELVGRALGLLSLLEGHRSYGPASARRLSRRLAMVPNLWLVKQLARRQSL